MKSNRHTVEQIITKLRRAAATFTFGIAFLTIGAFFPQHNFNL